MIAFTFLLKGFSALCAQVLLLREFFIILAGNELCSGAYFAIWLLAGALGSFIARYTRKRLTLFFFTLIVFEGFWLLFSLALIRSYHSIFGLFPGQIMGISQAILLIFITAGIFSLSQGIRFVSGANLMRAAAGQNSSAGLFYGWEAAGALAGGIVFAFLIQKYTDPFQTAAFIAIINMISFLPVFSFQKRKSLIFSYVALLFLASFFFFFPQQGLYSRLNVISLMKQWQAKNPPVYYANTHYGNISVFENNQQLSFMLDGQLFFTAPHPDLEWIESITHFPLLYANKTERILIIGAGIKGIIPEIMKYKVQSIDCVETNPEIVQVIKKFSPSHLQFFDNDKINIIEDDAIRLLRKTRKRWNVIIVDAGIPFSLKTARFYTKEFFELAKSHLSEQGILYIGIEGSPEYMSDPLVDVHKITHSTLGSVFPSVSIVPGYLTGYCAAKAINPPEMSDELLALRKKEKGISTTVITEFYLKDRLDNEKKRHFLKMIESGKEFKNSVNRPFIIIPAIRYWIFLSSGELRNIKKPIFLTTLIILFAISVVFLSGIKKNTRILEFTVFSTGFLSIAWELVFLFLFQMYFGSLYFYLSVLTGTFMSGMAAGSLAFATLSKKTKNWKEILFIWQLAQMSFAFFAVVFIALLSKIAVSIMPFFIIMAIIGIFSGWEFPLVNRIYISDKNLFSRSISTFYALDLAGATAGSIVVTLVLVPFSGIVLSCVFFGTIKLIAAIFVRKL